MKIAKLAPDGRIAAVEGSRLVDLNLAEALFLARERGEARPYALADAFVPADLLAFIQAGTAALDEAKTAVAFVLSSPANAKGSRGEQIVLDLASAKLLAPLPSLASKLICMGGNFRSMGAGRLPTAEPPSTRRPQSNDPRGFLKLATSVLNPGDELIHPARTKKLDSEVELAMILGKAGKDISQADAMSHAFGYSVFADYCTRDGRDREDYQFVDLSKNFDTSAALGPWIVTADEIGDPHDLTLLSRMNGKPRQSGTTKDMIHRFPEIIEFYSKDLTLYAGDLIASGTPSHAVDTGGTYLQPGDVVEMEIPAIGSFSNRVVAKVPAAVRVAVTA